MEAIRTTKYITLDGAKKMMAAAEAEALKNGWTVAIAIVDGAGLLLMFERIVDTQIGSIEVAIGKARTAVAFKRPTKALRRDHCRRPLCFSGHRRHDAAARRSARNCGWAGDWSGRRQRHAFNSG